MDSLPRSAERIDTAVIGAGQAGLAVGMRMPLPAASYPTKHQLADYLQGYAARFELPLRAEVKVDAVSRQGARYAVASQARTWGAANVVVATGAYQRPRVPAFAADLDKGIVQQHSSQYRRPAQLPVGAVLMVGAGKLRKRSSP